MPSKIKDTDHRWIMLTSNMILIPFEVNVLRLINTEVDSKCNYFAVNTSYEQIVSTVTQP